MRWKVMLDFLRDIFSALSHAAGDSADKEEPAPAPDVPTVDTVTGWAGEPPYRYIDVSRWQGTIDWEKVKSTEYRGVMLRALGNKGGNPYFDPCFEKNYAGAKAAGLDVGVYWYSAATTQADLNAELSMLKEAVRGKELTLPVAMDVEDSRLAVLNMQELLTTWQQPCTRSSNWAFMPSSTPIPALQTAIFSWAALLCPHLMFGWLTIPARPRKWISSTMPTSTPARAACRVSPATLTST